VLKLRTVAGCACDGDAVIHRRSLSGQLSAASLQSKQHSREGQYQARFPKPSDFRPFSSGESDKTERRQQQSGQYTTAYRAAA